MQSMYNIIFYVCNIASHRGGVQVGLTLLKIWLNRTPLEMSLNRNFSKKPAKQKIEQKIGEKNLYKLIGILFNR